MKKTILFLFAVFVLAFSGLAADNKSVANYLQDISVTVKSKQGTGSGVIYTRTNAAGESVNFIWTAGHVVAANRHERDMQGGKKVVEFDDLSVVSKVQEDGRIVGHIEFDAEVLRYSNADDGDDLSILRIRKKDYVKASVRFYPGKDIPPLGTELYHVGSLLGSFGENSMTAGIYSQYGRILERRLFDQTTVTAFPGSSGGGVFLKDGEYVGMLVRGAGEGFNLIVPIRRIQDWSKRVKAEWALDDKVPIPTDEELKKMPVDDSIKATPKRASENREPDESQESTGVSIHLLPFVPRPPVPFQAGPIKPAK